jgi:hypothetical protein
MYDLFSALYLEGSGHASIILFQGNQFGRELDIGSMSLK